MQLQASRLDPGGSWAARLTKADPTPGPPVASVQGFLLRPRQGSAGSSRTQRRCCRSPERARERGQTQYAGARAGSGGRSTEAGCDSCRHVTRGRGSGVNSKATHAGRPKSRSCSESYRGGESGAATAVLLAEPL